MARRRMSEGSGKRGRSTKETEGKKDRKRQRGRKVEREKERVTRKRGER